MKVHVYGNTLNIAYYLTTYLRLKGIDAEMFLDNSSSYQQDYPWWEDSSLSIENLPSWIHYYPLKPFFLIPGRETKSMIKNFSQCDIALVTSYGPVMAMKAKVPFIFYSIGSDLNCIDIADELTSLVKTRVSIKNKIRRLIKIAVFTPLQKAALQKHASKLLVGMGYQVNQYINQFGLQDRMIRMRFPYDIEKYKSELDETLYGKYKKYDIVFFMIARHCWKELYGDPKGNDKFLKAFAMFIKDTRANVKLVLIRKGIDYKASEKLVIELGIESYVEWVDQMNKEGIRSYESLPNCVVVDQFWNDNWHERFKFDASPKIGFGIGAVEALSAGRPLITGFFDTEFYEDNMPPILHAFTINEIYERLIEVNNMSFDERKELGEKGQKFITKWHDWHTVIDTFVQIMEEVLEKSNELKLEIERN